MKAEDDNNRQTHSIFYKTAQNVNVQFVSFRLQNQIVFVVLLHYWHW